MSTNLSSLTDEGTDSSDSKTVNNEQVLLSFKKSLIDLTLKANGKADLYFHAYLWHIYILTLI